MFKKNEIYEIMTPDGWKDFNGIDKKNKKILYKIVLEDLSSFTSTLDHEFYINGNRIKIDNINVGDKIDTLNGNKKIISKEKHREDVVYDIINVNNNKHNFILTESDAITKNCDEFAFVPGHQAEEFWASNYPTISASEKAKIIIISTPNGLFNIFHRIWTHSKNKLNTFVNTKISWEEVPGRNKKWAEEQIKNLGQQKFNQEFAVKFIGSTNTVINAETIKVLMASWKEPKFMDLQDRLSVFEKPIEGASYVLGGDPSKGTGQNWATIQIIKLISINPVKMEQVAVFRDNLTDVYDYSEILSKLSYYYNNGYIMCENNGEGSAVVQRLWWDIENENLVNSGQKTEKLGIRSTTKTKPKAVLLMKKLIEDGSVKLYDKETIEELGSYIEEGTKFFGKDKADDLVSALYWAIYVLEMNILDESYEFIEKKEEEDAWGILSDTEDSITDWKWLTNSNLFD